VRVLGPVDRLAEFAGRERVDEVLVSTSKLANERNDLLIASCHAAGLRYRRMRISLE
jgi:hypothetical protein